MLLHLRLLHLLLGVFLVLQEGVQHLLGIVLAHLLVGLLLLLGLILLLVVLRLLLLLLLLIVLLILVLLLVVVLLILALILILLIPYIRHYYILENEVQKMYVQYDRMRRLQQTAAGIKLEKPER